MAAIPPLADSSSAARLDSSQTLAGLRRSDGPAAWTLWALSRMLNLFFFFDVGVRHAAAELELRPVAIRANPGPVFEQWVGIELWKRLRYLGSGKLHYLRSKAGAEVDFIVEQGGRLAPIEVKWTENPSLSDARHLVAFLAEQPRRAKRGYVICRCDKPPALSDRITALPYFLF